MQFRSLMAAAVLPCLLGACGGGGDEAPVSKPLEFSVLDNSVGSAIRQARFTTTRSETDWQSLWDEHIGPFGTAEAPAVDFQSQMVVGVFVGERPSGCFTASIRRVVQEEHALRIEYTDGVPPGPQICTQGFVYPAVVAAVARTDLPMSFRRVDP